MGMLLSSLIAFISFWSYIGVILESYWEKEGKCHVSGQLLSADIQWCENQ